MEKSKDHDTLVSELGNVFDLNSAFGHPFSGLKSRHNQIKYYKNEFGLLVRDVLL